MTTLTTESVRALAPDAGALKAGQALATAGRWSGLGRSERALWGRCQGSGKEPYAVSVDLGMDAPAAKCSCPSRKFPCKHALGLMLLATSAPQAVPDGNPPEWTATWLEGRSARVRTVATKAAGGEAGAPTLVVDEKARARRIATRERRVAAGLEEFGSWVRDIARRGLAEVAGEGLAPFEAAAARLVDAQAAGIARAVRAAGRRIAAASGDSLPSAARTGRRRATGSSGPPAGAGDGAGWADDLLDVMGRLFLLSETYGRGEALPEPLRTEVRTLVGWTIRETELPETDLVEDSWFVLGRRHEADDRLRATRTYLRGRASGRDAVILDWEPLSSRPSNEPPVGSAIRGVLAFYPSATPMRAVNRGPWVADPSITAPAGAATWREGVAPYATALGANPWLERSPALVAAVLPVRDGQRTLYRDAAGDVVGCRFAEGAAASLRAFAGGHAVTLFGEWDGTDLTVLAAGDGSAWVPLDGTEDVAPGETVVSVAAGSDPAWDALRAHAILGTSRSAPGPELAQLTARMADRSPEDALLAMAASLSVRRRASPVIEPLPAAERLPPAAAESARPAPPAVARALGSAIGNPVLVRDWVKRAAAAGVLAPPQLLPRLLAISGIEQFEGFEPVIGARGAWLRGLGTPAGATTAPTTNLGEPGEAKALGPEIAELLAAARAADPATARAWLDAAWPNLSPATRGAAIGALEVGLGVGDAALLDRLVGEETAKARREALAGLACRVPGSAVRARIEARAGALVSIKKGLLNRSLEINPPSEEVIDAMERDGLTFPPQLAKATAADRLLHVFVWHIAHVAPAFWVGHLGLSAADVVRALSGQKRLASLTAHAFRQVAVAHRDGAFAEVLLAGPAPSYGSQGTGLWRLVPLERRQQAMARILFQRPDPTDWMQATSLDEALASMPLPWSRDLVAMVRYDIRNTAAQVGDPRSYVAAARLRALVTHLPAEYLAEAHDVIAERVMVSGDRPGLDAILELIAARRDLAAAFAA